MFQSFHATPFISAFMRSFKMGFSTFIADLVVEFNTEIKEKNNY